MFIATDPTGSAFGVWQAGTHIGAGIASEPGGMTWEDLRTSDPDTARAFYEAVFGYVFQAVDGAPEDYTTFHLPGDEAPLGGMGGMFGAEGAPPHWLVYFGVADADAAVAAAERRRRHGRRAGVRDALRAHGRDHRSGRRHVLGDPGHRPARPER